MLEQITTVLYLKLIKATYVQVCWLFGAYFSPTSSFLSSPSNFRAAGLLLKTEGKGSLEQIAIVLYLKLIKATYVQVCWQFGDNFSAISSFLSSSQILEQLAFY